MMCIFASTRTTPWSRMLSLLNISNIALIDELRVEFGRGLNLLTGETGSGKSIIVDALGILIGGRFTSDLLKTDAERGSIEGLFSVTPSPPLAAALAAAGIEGEIGHGAEGAYGPHGEATPEMDIIIRRELAAPGRNKIFINNQLATQSLLRELRPFLVDIHGQGDQQTLFSPETHLELLDAFTPNAARLAEVGDSNQN
jgi:DNA repair protein RecN (Recombination protein N)